MKTFSYVLQDKNGIHARPAGLLVKEAKKYSSKILVKKDEKEVSADSILSLMGLGAKCGDCLQVEISGEDESDAYAGLEAFFRENL